MMSLEAKHNLEREHEPEQALLTIGEVAVTTGMSARTLRFYEERELLRSVRIGHVRHYGLEQQKRLAKITYGKKVGLSLSEIAKLMSSDMDLPDSCKLSLNRDFVATRIRELEEQRGRIDDALDELRKIVDNKTD